MSYYERIRNEKQDLDDKIEKLRAFIWDGNKVFEALPMVDVDLMMTQLHTMRQYSEILGKRISRASLIGHGYGRLFDVEPKEKCNE